MTMYAVNTLADVPAGQPGDVSRAAYAIIEPAQFADADTAVEPGRAVCYDANGKLEYFTGEEGQDVRGLTVRTYPHGSGYPESINIPAGTFVGVLRRGWALVRCKGVKAPVKGGEVYMYTAAKDTTAKVGDFATASTDGTVVKISGARWASNGVDANGIAEIEIL